MLRPPTPTDNGRVPHSKQVQGQNTPSPGTSRGELQATYNRVPALGVLAVLLPWYATDQEIDRFISDPT